MIRGAVFFDVDGTLTPTSSGQHLSGLLGNAKEIEQIQAGYGAGALSSYEAALLEARGWARRTPPEAHAFLESLPLVDGIAETVLWCRTHSLVPVLATLAWDIVGTRLCSRFHFDRACGPRLEIGDGRYSERSPNSSTSRASAISPAAWPPRPGAWVADLARQIFDLGWRQAPPGGAADGPWDREPGASYWTAFSSFRSSGSMSSSSSVSREGSGGS